MAQHQLLVRAVCIGQTSASSVAGLVTAVLLAPMCAWACVKLINRRIQHAHERFSAAIFSDDATEDTNSDVEELDAIPRSQSTTSFAYVVFG